MKNFIKEQIEKHKETVNEILLQVKNGKTTYGSRPYNKFNAVDNLIAVSNKIEELERVYKLLSSDL